KECLAQAGASLKWLPSLQPNRTNWESILETLADLYVRGAQIDWEAFDAGFSRHRVSLPTYPFERQRCWIDETEIKTKPSETSSHPLLGRKLPRLAHKP